MSTPLKTLLIQALRENNYSFSDASTEQFLSFLELLQKWNRVFNLTALTEASDLVYLHILDSLSILPFLHGATRLDVGSGGGLPGIPLAIAEPEKSWVLLDKSQKKTRFLVQAVAELGLKNVSVVCGRCESFQTESRFDSILSRALGTITLFLEGTQHLIHPEGYFLAMKGTYPAEELAEIPATFRLRDVQKLIIRGLQAERHVVRVQKK